MRLISTRVNLPGYVEHISSILMNPLGIDSVFHNPGQKSHPWSHMLNIVESSMCALFPNSKCSFIEINLTGTNTLL